LARASAAIDAAGALSTEQARAVLDARASALSRPPTAGRDASETLEVVRFVLGRERYAIEARYVRAILRSTDVAPIPGMPDFVAGITHLRGEILAVVDLRRFFGISEGGITDLGKLIVVGGDHAEFGILADSVQEVLTLRRDRILPAPATTGGEGREHVRGITDEAVTVLDGAVLLADERLYIDQIDDVRV